jgi:hypothetical protein
MDKDKYFVFYASVKKWVVGTEYLAVFDKKANPPHEKTNEDNMGDSPCGTKNTGCT